MMGPVRGPTLGPQGVQTNLFADMTPSLSCRTAKTVQIVLEPSKSDDAAKARQHF